MQNNFISITTNFRWLCDGEFPVSPQRDSNIDTTFNVTPMSFPFFKFLYIWLIPIIFGAIGIFIYKLRTRY